MEKRWSIPLLSEFLTFTATYADVVLPASPSLEKDGTFTNTERRIQRLYLTENGYGKRTPVNDYRLSNRGGKGIKTATITERNGNVVCITTVTGEEDLMIVTNAGVIIRLDVADISQNGRAAQGVRLIRLGDDQFVSTVAKVKEDADEENEDEQSTVSEDGTEQQREAVVNDETPGNAIHTEVIDSEVNDEDGRIEVRQDFMDRVEEDIQQSSDDDEE